MSLFDEDLPKKKTQHDIGSDLSLLSVDELTIRIEMLKIEIGRLEKERDTKSASKAAAANLFKI